jgi:DNA-binding XRE family transcriptional regulator
MRRSQPSQPEKNYRVDQFYHDVGLLIRDARKKANNMTQEALALSVGLTRTSLTNVEKGRQKLLLHTFTQIAVVLSVQPTDLLPKNQNLPNNLRSELPSSLAPAEIGFIERAITTGGNYANKQITNGHIKSKKLASKQRILGSTS